MTTINFTACFLQALDRLDSITTQKCNQSVDQAQSLSAFRDQFLARKPGFIMISLTIFLKLHGKF